MAAIRAALIFTVFLSACAGPALSDAQCKSANWYEVGRTDALLGRQPQLMSYSKSCDGVVVDEKQYLAGWNIGYSEWNLRVSPRK